MRTSPYLIFNGDCEAAFRFYAGLFGTELEFIQTYGETPAASQVPEHWHDRVIHVSLARGDLRLMGSDGMPNDTVRAGNVHVSLDVEQPEEAERLFAALAEGGQVQMPIGETFWAQRFGMAVDRFGIPWMVNCSLRGD